jgi:integrase/recombinase XerD
VAVRLPTKRFCRVAVVLLQRAHYFRARWLFTLLYLGGLRIPDVSANTMGRFIARCDADGHECWGLAVLGKGDKERLVSATNAMAAAHS